MGGCKKDKDDRYTITLSEGSITLLDEICLHIETYGEGALNCPELNIRESINELIERHLQGIVDAINRVERWPNG